MKQIKSTFKLPFFLFYEDRQHFGMIEKVSIFFTLKQQKHAKPVVSHVSTASVYLYTHRHVHTYTYTYTLVM